MRYASSIASTMVIGALIYLLLFTMSKGALDKEWFQMHVTQRYSSIVRETLLPEAKREAVKRFSDEDLQWKFIYSFFKGYMHKLENTGGRVYVGGPGSPHQTGFDNGLYYCKELSAATNQPLSLADFGYVPMTVAGTYGWAFEESDFRPSEKEEKWWVDFAEGVVKRIAKKLSEKENTLFNVRRSCTFKGYLSPDQIGFTGHENQYDREFIVVEILEVGPQPPPSPDVDIEVTIENWPTNTSTSSSSADASEER